MRVRRVVISTLILLVLLAIFIALLVRWLVVSDPSWYQRIEVDPAQVAQRQRELTNQFNSLRNEVGRAQAASATQKSFPAFEVELTEAQINSTVSRWQDWPGLPSAVSRVSEPHVRFLDDRIELAGRIQANGPLVNIALSVRQTPEGPKVELGRPYAGRMPLTRAPLEELVDEIEGRLKGGQVPPPTVDFIKQLLTGEELSPIVAVPTSVVGKQDVLPARIEKLTIKDGVLRATLRPFDPKAPRAE